MIISCRNNLYDNVEEFWVTIRETGSREEKLTHEEKHRETSADTEQQHLVRSIWSSLSIVVQARSLHN